MNKLTKIGLTALVLGFSLTTYKGKEDFDKGIDSFFSRVYIPTYNVVYERDWSKKIDCEYHFQKKLEENRENYDQSSRHGGHGVTF